MLDTTLELIALVSSNSHLVFCFCNLIIGLLLVSSSKSSSESSLSNSTKNVCLSVIPKGANKSIDKQEEYVLSTSDVTKGSSLDVEELLTPTEEMNDKSKDEKIDDELKKRADEFIEKINRGWKAEKLGSFSPYVQNEQIQA